jgi:hypothetical protein
MSAMADVRELRTTSGARNRHPRAGALLSGENIAGSIFDQKIFDEAA